MAAVLGEEERLARRVLSGVAASLCLLLVARAVDGVVIVKEPLISTGMMKTSLLQ